MGQGVSAVGLSPYLWILTPSLGRQCQNSVNCLVVLENPHIGTQER